MELKIEKFRLVDQILDWLLMALSGESPLGLSWKRKLLNETSQTPNFGF